MEVSCPKCQRRYRIPDHTVNNRRVFFFCEHCNEKITVQGTIDPWASYGGLSGASFSIKDLVDGIYLSFNIKNILLSFGVQVSIFFCVLVGYFLYRVNEAFIHTSPLLRVLLLTMAAVPLVFLFDLHLYLLSKNVFSSIRGGGGFRISEERSVFMTDLKAIFSVSSFHILVIGILLLPIYPLNRTGLVYSGFIFSFLLASMIVLLAGIMIKPLIMSYLAMTSRGTILSIQGLMKFIAVENINLLVYGVFSAAFTTIVSGCMVFIAVASIALLSQWIRTLFGSGLLQEEGSGTLTAMMEWFLADRSSVGVDQITGLLMILATIIMLGLLLLAFLCNLMQTLATVAVWIMAKNPGKSVNRRYLLLFTGIIFIAFFLMVLYRFFP